MKQPTLPIEDEQLSADSSRFGGRFEPGPLARVFGPFAASLVHLAFPPRCAFCGAAGVADPCEGCRRDVPGRAISRCHVCAIDVPCLGICGQCLSEPPAFSRVVAAGSYAFPLDALVQRLKYARDLRLVAPLAELLMEAARGEPRPDLVLPMPLGAARLRERGFNQSAELARSVARRLNLPLDPGAAVRARDGAPQASLPFDRRARNVRGAFAVRARLNGLRVAVVDDVMTTGATLKELAATLRHAGAREVTAWVLARTPRR